MFPRRRQGLFIKGKQDEQHIGFLYINMGTTPNKWSLENKERKRWKKTTWARKESNWKSILEVVFVLYLEGRALLSRMIITRKEREVAELIIDTTTDPLQNKCTDQKQTKESNQMKQVSQKCNMFFCFVFSLSDWSAMGASVKVKRTRDLFDCTPVSYFAFKCCFFSPLLNIIN